MTIHTEVAESYMMFSLKKGMIACNPSLAHVNELKEEKYENYMFHYDRR